MNTISLKITDDAILANYYTNQNSDQARKIMITYNADQSIGDNLETIRVKLVGIPFDAIIIENPLAYPFSDTIVGVNHQRIDIGLALTNMFNVPVVARPTVDQIGLESAVMQKQDYNAWHLDYYGQYQSKRNFGQEAMLTIGNGFFGLRGAYVEAKADQDNYPGMYVAGMYNQLTTSINGRDVVNEDLVNLPNAQYLSFGIDHENRFKIQKSDIRDIYRSLDLKTGQLTTSMIINLSTGHQLAISTTKIADMKNWHRFTIRYQITPLNFAGNMQVYSEIDGNVINGNVERYSEFDQHHLDITNMWTDQNIAVLGGQTKTSKIRFAIGAKLSTTEKLTDQDFKTRNTNQSVTQVINFDVTPEKTYTFEKVVSVFTSLESPTDQLDELAQKEVSVGSFTNTEDNSRLFFKRLWHDTDIKITGDLTSQKLSRVNIFHLFVSAQAIGQGQLDASIGARGLHGEAYRGHVFWDEMFVMPFYISHYPQLAKQLLLYRYHRLPAAREYAISEHHKGAMFPWQSGMTGDEQSQFVHLNPLTNQWEPDNSRLQRHVSLAIAYNVWSYYQITQDHEFLARYGLELLLSIAKFWLSMAQFDPKTKRFNISNVMGPDEFHEEYPNSDQQGLTNNAYTNMMVVWLFNSITTLANQVSDEQLQTIKQKCDFSSVDLDQMQQVSHQLKLDINEDGIIGQFEGYFNLPTLNFDNYRKKYGDISRLDRILKSEGKTPDAYQVAKQADTLMAYYNLGSHQVNQILNQLDYHLPAHYFSHNLQFYLDRTTHGSTLSRIVYADLTQANGNADQSWKLFRQALFSDYYDIQGGTTAEGIHLGVMGATLGLETYTYGGVSLLGEQISVEPKLPRQWQQLEFSEHYRGTKVHFIITHHDITVQADRALDLMITGHSVSLKAKQPVSIQY
ncbi:glycoside hydrolase family 65 protein [Paucilactobacillus sp. N302-9]